jgi:hypothetical protein
VSLVGVRWPHPTGGFESFASTRPGYGVVDENGRFLSRDGITPSSWRTKSLAEEIAEYAIGFPDSWGWIEVDEG